MMPITISDSDARRLTELAAWAVDQFDRGVHPRVYADDRAMIARMDAYFEPAVTTDSGMETR